MATYNLGSGGQLVVTPPNPVELATRLAQLASLQQQPGIEQAKLVIEQQNAARLAQQLKQQGEQATASLGEETRFHTGTLDQAQKALAANVLNEQQKLAEETRFHTGQLGESQAGRESAAALEQARLRGGALADVLAHGQELNVGAPGATSEIAAQLGFPQIKSGLDAAKAANVATRATALAATLKNSTPEQVSAMVSTIKDPTTGQVDPAMGNAVWTAWKGLTGQLGGAPPTAALPPTTVTGAPATTTPSVASLTSTVGGAPSAVAPTPQASAASLLAAMGGAQSTYSPIPLSMLTPPTAPGVVGTDRGNVQASMGIVNPAGGTFSIPGVSTDTTGATPAPPAAVAPTTTVAAPPALPPRVSLASLGVPPTIGGGALPGSGAGATPGFDLGSVLKYAPVDLANLGVAGMNVGTGVTNTLNSLFGLPPIARQTQIPRDYSRIASGQF